MMYIEIIICLVGCYLIGSIPIAVMYGKIFHRIDVRNHGSGNAGATNTLRTLGKKAGLIVMTLDALKGWLATYFATILLNQHIIEVDQEMMFQLIFGIAAVLGHIFPVFANFRGGKGIATLLGMILSINLEIALVCMVVFLIVFLLSKYVSLGSILAALAFPVTIILFPKLNDGGSLVILLGFAIFSLVVLTHKKNIVRIINGEESKMSTSKRNKDNT